MHSRTKLLLLSILLCSFLIVMPLMADPLREIFLTEDFTSTTFPPTGWTISAQSGNWSRFNGNSAGGTSPELRFNYSPTFTGESYFISPNINTTGLTSIYLDFKQLVDHYTTPYQIGVATRSAAGTWNNVWTVNPNGNIGPETRTIIINNTDVGSDTFQFAFFFNGYSYNIDYWYIDDIKLYTPFMYDLAIVDTPGNNHVDAGLAYTPSCIIKNVGVANLGATVSLDIYEWDTLLQNLVSNQIIQLASGESSTVSFPDFIMPLPDELYKFVFHVTSIEDVVDGDLTNNQKTKYIDTYLTPKQMVLLEIGTGAWCTYCPGAAMGADDLVNNGQNVAVIENHNGDPYATTTSDARNTYYGITGFPTAIFDGVLKLVGGNHSTSMYPSYLPLYNQRANLKTPIELHIYGQLNRDTYSIQIYIDKHAHLINSNLALHFAVTESDIQYTWQGQTELNFVNRLMVPGPQGTPIDLFNLTEPQLVVPLEYTQAAEWVAENCELIAFVQDLDTKEVLQATKVLLFELEAPPVANNDITTPAIITKLIGNYPNPFNPKTTITYSVKETTPVRIEIYNLKGQLVKTLLNDNKAAGTYSIDWLGTDNNGKPVASGVYQYKMFAGKYSSTRKMILMK